jgi:hypothetical protein
MVMSIPSADIAAAIARADSPLPVPISRIRLARVARTKTPTSAAISLVPAVMIAFLSSYAVPA